MNSKTNTKIRLILMNFLEFAVWGAYLTSQGRYLASIGLGPQIGWFYSIQGIVSIFSRHSTSAIVVNENERGLLNELEFMLDNLVSDKFSYEHDRIDDNARSHLKSFLLSSSECLPVKNGKLDLGTWQSVFFIELDGPRRARTVTLTMVGE